MLTWCEGCGHSLWSEAREAPGIRLEMYFDDDERSVTYAEHVTRCPNCGLSLVENTQQATRSDELRTLVTMVESSYIGTRRQ